MKPKGHHNNRIRTLEFDIYSDDSSSANELLSQLESKIKNSLISIIDDVLLEESKGKLISFNELEIDLGVVEVDEIEERLVEKLREALFNQLSGKISKEVLALDEGIDQLAEKQTVYQVRTSNWEVVFLQTGILPWWVEEDIMKDIASSMKEWIRSNQHAFLKSIQENYPIAQYKDRIEILFGNEQLQNHVGVDLSKFWNESKELFESAGLSQLIGGISFPELWKSAFVKLLETYIVFSKEGKVNKEGIILLTLLQFLANKVGKDTLEVMLYVQAKTSDYRTRRTINDLIASYSTNQRVNTIKWTLVPLEQLLLVIAKQKDPFTFFTLLFPQSKSLYSPLRTLLRGFAEVISFTSSEEKSVEQELIFSLTLGFMTAKGSLETLLSKQGEWLVKAMLERKQLGKEVLIQLVSRLDKSEKSLEDIKLGISEIWKGGDKITDKEVLKIIQTIDDKSTATKVQETIDAIVTDEQKQKEKIYPDREVLKYLIYGVVPEYVIVEYSDVREWVKEILGRGIFSEDVKKRVVSLTLTEIDYLIVRAERTEIPTVLFSEIFENNLFSSLVEESGHSSFQQNHMLNERVMEYVVRRLIKTGQVAFRPKMDAGVYIEQLLTQYNETAKKIINNLSSLEVIRLFQQMRDRSLNLTFSVIESVFDFADEHVFLLKEILEGDWPKLNELENKRIERGGILDTRDATDESDIKSQSDIDETDAKTSGIRELDIEKEEPHLQIDETKEERLDLEVDDIVSELVDEEIEIVEDQPVDSEIEEKAKEAIESSIFLTSAGIVLLGSYLPRLFGRLDLLNEENNLIDLRSKQKALELMHYLVFGTDEIVEQHTIIFKIMADLPVSLPTPKMISLSSEEKELCDGLLKAVVGNWPALKGSTIDNLRGSFLIRDAKLVLEKSVYNLYVEEKPYDMLLDKLPWSYRFIKFKWMETPIQVEWR
ncbi:contractile injection system tape measure protein [Reichenbachiella versicolor]|uniref:contractile injection system tape measure protein n=1 Tax=Reichenbachiella versicolor TaxID=1821036 RepID=UPI000D6E2357|nr:contractile injection system tape measure protein [Reichenbachiella versicolor]